jgi:hypothetical protein
MQVVGQAETQKEASCVLFTAIHAENPMQHKFNSVPR